jgi:uncharacterized protein YdhG (YjbR/CyaY superfamily)
MTTPASVDDYMTALPDESRAVLEDLRKSIQAAAPQATETISYNMPTFKEGGRFLVSFAAYKNHFSLYPASKEVMEAHGEELQPYFSGRGTLRFTADNPLPAALVKKIIRTRLKENAVG